MAITIPEEGDALNASSLNTPLNTLRADVNALTRAELAARGLGDVHLPSRATGDGLVTVFSAVSPPGIATGGNLYANTLPNGATGGVQGHLETFVAQIYGPYAGPALGGVPHTDDEGWLIPSATGGATHKMEIALTAAHDLADGVTGLRMTAWVDLQEADNQPGIGDVENNATTERGEGALYLGIGVEDESGTRHVIHRSIGRYSTRACSFGPCTTKLTLEAADLSEGTLDGTVAKVFAAVLSGVWDGGGNQHGTLDPYIKHYALVIEPLYGSELA